MIDVGDEALELLTAAEVAKKLRLSEVKVRRLIADELREPGTGIESVKIGRSRRVAPEAVAAFKAGLIAASRAA